MHVQRKLADLEHEMEAKADAAQLQHCKKAIMSIVDSKIAGLEQVMQEKVNIDQIQQVRGIISSCQGQMASMEQEIHQKVGFEQMQQLKSACSSLEAQISTFEHALQDKFCANQAQQLKGTVGSLENKLEGLEGIVQQKAGATQVQQLSHTVSSTSTKVASIERTVSEIVSSLPQAECRRPASGLDRLLRDRARPALASTAGGGAARALTDAAGAVGAAAAPGQCKRESVLGQQGSDFLLQGHRSSLGSHHALEFAAAPKVFDAPDPLRGVAEDVTASNLAQLGVGGGASRSLFPEKAAGKRLHSGAEDSSLPWERGTRSRASLPISFSPGHASAR